MSFELRFNMDEELVKLGELDLETSAIYAAVSFSNGGYHSGILITYDGSSHFFHFLGPRSTISLDIDLEDENLILKKIVSVIQSDEIYIEAFLNFCLRIKKKSNILYGHIFGIGRYSAEEAVFESETTLPEISNCVGFCLNVLTGFLNCKSFFQYSDWSLHPLDYKERNYVRHIERWLGKDDDLNVPASDMLDSSEFFAHHRKINSIEYLASGFCSEEQVPIRKVILDPISEPLFDAFHQVLEA